MTTLCACTLAPLSRQPGTRFLTRRGFQEERWLWVSRLDLAHVTAPASSLGEEELTIWMRRPSGRCRMAGNYSSESCGKSVSTRANREPSPSGGCALDRLDVR